jgi:hypothetical protein
MNVEIEQDILHSHDDDILISSKTIAILIRTRRTAARVPSTMNPNHDSLTIALLCAFRRPDVERKAI